MTMSSLFSFSHITDWFVISVSGIATLIFCLFSKKIAGIFGTFDHPGGRKLHTNATPLMGGLIICLIVIPAIISLLPMQNFAESEFFLLSTILATSFAIAFIGILDDRHDIDPKIRLIYGLVAFSITIALNPSLLIQVLVWSSILPPMGFNIFSGAVTVFAFLVLLNAVNMADGKNGLVIGLSLGWSALIMSYLPDNYAPVMMAIIVVLSILMIFNMRGLLFLGDGGAYGFATLIGLLAVHVYTMPGSHVPADSIALLFGIPAVDMLRLMFSRWSRGHSPFSADRDHFHHHLQEVFGWPLGLLFYLALVLIPSFIDRLFPSYGLFLLVAVMAIYSSMVWWIHATGRVSGPKTHKGH